MQKAGERNEPKLKKNHNNYKAKNMPFYIRTGTAVATTTTDNDRPHKDVMQCALLCIRPNMCCLNLFRWDYARFQSLLLPRCFLSFSTSVSLIHIDFSFVSFPLLTVYWIFIWFRIILQSIVRLSVCCVHLLSIESQHRYDDANGWEYKRAHRMFVHKK